MKAIKGQREYLSELKKRECNICILEWLVGITIFIFGLIIFGTFFNILTILSICGILLAIRSSVKVIVKRPHIPMEEDKANALTHLAEYMTVIYNPILTSRDKIMGLETIVISDSTIMIYVSNETTDEEYTSRFLRTILTKSYIQKPNVKVFTDYKMFMDRVEGLYNMASISKVEKSPLEARIESIILGYCM